MNFKLSWNSNLNEDKGNSSILIAHNFRPLYFFLDGFVGVCCCLFFWVYNALEGRLIRWSRCLYPATRGRGEATGLNGQTDSSSSSNFVVILCVDAVPLHHGRNASSAFVFKDHHHQKRRWCSRECLYYNASFGICFKNLHPSQGSERLLGNPEISFFIDFCFCLA